MIVIQKGVYSHDEVIKQLGIKTGPRNKKEKIERELRKLGYKFSMPRGKVEIIEAPADTDILVLKDMLVEKFGMDVRIDARGFALHTFGLLMDDNYANMPNLARAEYLLEKYNIDVTDRTLTSWTSKLINRGIVEKVGKEEWWEKTYWMTTQTSDGKVQIKVDKNDPDRERWYKLFWEKQPELGKQIGRYMWDKTNCFYFSCLPFRDTRCAWGTPEEQEEFVRICTSVLGGEYVHVEIKDYEPETRGIDIEMSDEEYEALYREQTAEPQTQSATKVEEEYEDPWFMRDEAPAPANSKSSSSCLSEEEIKILEHYNYKPVVYNIFQSNPELFEVIDAEHNLVVVKTTGEIMRVTG